MPLPVDASDRTAPRGGARDLEQERAALRRLTAGGMTAADSDVAPLIRRATRAILLLLWLFAIGTAVISGWLLLHHAKTHTATTAISLEQFARRTLTVAAFAVDEYEEFLDASGGLPGASSADGEKKLRGLAKWLPEGSAMGVASPQGEWVASTSPIGPSPPRVSDRRWFLAHVRDGLASYVGPAILSRLSNRYVFTYTEAYRSPEGALLGVINLGIPSGSITGLAPDQHSTRLALVQHEGLLVAALPFRPDMIEKPFPLPADPPAIEATSFGSMFGRWSVVTVRNIPDLKLYAVVAEPVTLVLQPLLWGLGIGLPVLLLLTNLMLIMSNQLQKKSKQVEQALSDNKVLFQEVHHRVKNNLQVVSSLLRLQAERLPPDLRPLLDETGARVRAIALVHEQIYRTASPSDVQLDRFLAQLVQQLSASMISGTARIATDLAPVNIPLDRAVPVAILATEAITNAIKHGLQDGDGAITVRLARRDGRNVLTVEDNGTGLTEDSKSGLGTRIMTALTRQIDGDWSLGASASGGTCFTLAWPAT